MLLTCFQSLVDKQTWPRLDVQTDRRRSMQTHRYRDRSARGCKGARMPRRWTSVRKCTRASKCQKVQGSSRPCKGTRSRFHTSGSCTRSKVKKIHVQIKTSELGSQHNKFIERQSEQARATKGKQRIQERFLVEKTTRPVMHSKRNETIKR